MKSFKVFSSIFFLVLFSLISGRGWGQILTFDFISLAGDEATANSNFNNVGLTSSTISRGAGLSASPNTDRFNATGWAVTSIDNAVAGNDYMEFTITPNSGQQFSVSSIVIQFQRSATGHTAIALRNSVDSYVSNLDGQKGVTDNTLTQTFTFTFAQTNSTTAVTYRLYGFAEAAGGTGGPGDGTGNDIVVNGSVTPAINAPSVTNSSQCGSGIPTASLADNNSFTTPQFKWYTAQTGGTLLQTSTSNTYLSTVSTTTTFYVSVVNPSNSIESARTPVTVSVNPIPSVVLNPSTTQNLCLGVVQNINCSTSATLLQENFNSATNNWTLTNSSSGGTVANAAWTLRPNGYSYGSTPVTFNSNDNSQFYMSNSDSQGSGGTTVTTLTSPVISTLGATSGTISFYHYFRSSTSSDAGRLQYSTDGITFINIVSYTATTGAANNFSLTTISLPAGALNQPTLYIRFRFEATWGWYWLLDNVAVTVNVPNISFSPVTDLFTDINATTAYTGNPTTVYSKPTANRTYTATATTAAGCTASSTVTINVGAPTQQSVASTDYIWKGTTSSAWGTLANWTQFDGSVYTTPSSAPSSTSVVLIPANNTCVQNQPAIGSLSISVQDFKIESGATTTLNSGAQLTISGTLTNNGTLTIESGATFVQGPSSTIASGTTGTYNVKQTVTGAGGAGVAPTGRFWYMGVPLNNLTRGAAFGTAGTDNRLWSWSESSQAWSSQLPDNTVLAPTTGYVFRTGATSTTLNFSGTSLYSADASITGLTNTTGSFDGCHLMSNPYTAYLDWEAVIAAAGTTNLSSTYCVRTFNTGSNTMVYDTYNANGDVAVNPSGVAMTRYIAPMQAFWIVVNPSTTGSISMTKSMLSHQSGAVGLKDITSFPAFARLNLVSGSFIDQVVVYTDVNATAEFDDYDSKKFFLPNMPQVYCPVGDKKTVINALKHGKAQTSAPLTVELPSTQVYKFEMAESFVENGLVILEDKQEGIFQDMGVNPVYEFYGNSGVIADRFVLHFHLPNGTNNGGQPGNGGEAGVEDLTSGQIAVIANHDGAVNVVLSADLTTSGDIQIFDEAGRLVAQKAITSAQTSLQLNNGMGVYFVRVQTPMKTEMKKVMVY